MKLLVKNWKKFTSDKYILDIVTNGLQLDFKEFPKNRQYQSRTLKNDELDIAEADVDKLLGKQVICESERERNVFTRNKKDAGKPMILNVKECNTFITYCHFKMEAINYVIDIVRPNMYIVSIDLKDEFYSIPIHPGHQKYLKFVVLSKMYHDTCMTNGYGPVMDQPCISLREYPKFLFYT